MTPKLEVATYAARLPRAVASTRHAWTERRGILLTIESAGFFGQGEAAPLPGYSDDTFGAVHAWLRSVPRSAVLPLLELSIQELGSALRGLVPKHLPSARFALETSVLDLRARRLGVPLHQLLAASARAPEPVPLCALIDAEVEPSGWGEQARLAAAAGFAAAKVKIGRRDRFTEELAGLVALRRATPPDFGLRLDANGAFDARAAQERMAALTQFAPEFLEEPLPCGLSLDLPPPLPIALDESLRRIDPFMADRKAQCGVAAWVLKPGVLGGVLRCLTIAESARTLGIAAVVSHAFEGTVGFAASCELALALGPARYAHGLAAHAALAPWNALPASLSAENTRLATHAKPGLGLPRLAAPGPAEQ